MTYVFASSVRSRLPPARGRRVGAVGVELEPHELRHGDGSRVRLSPLRTLIDGLNQGVGQVQQNRILPPARDRGRHAGKAGGVGGRAVQLEHQLSPHEAQRVSPELDLSTTPQGLLPKGNVLIPKKPGFVGFGADGVAPGSGGRSRAGLRGGDAKKARGGACGLGQAEAQKGD